MDIQEKIKEFAPVAELMPGVIVIHELKGFKPLYMSSKGLNLLGISLDDLIALEDNYKKVVLNDTFMNDYLSSLEDMLAEEEIPENYSIFHEVQLKDNEAFSWYASSIKSFHKNTAGETTHTITIAFPLGHFQHIPHKAEKLLKESMFSKTHLKKFLSLSPRAVEVLKLVALGNSTQQIAEKLNISPDTVSSHRRIIKQKLEISTSYDFIKYARSYDLI